MKNDIERLLLFLIPAIFVEKILHSYISSLFGDLFSGDLSSLNKAMERFPSYTVGELIAYVNTTNVLIGLLPTVVIAVWLWKIEKINNGRPFLWALGAIFLKYWILLLFIGQRVYEKESTK